MGETLLCCYSFIQVFLLIFLFLEVFITEQTLAFMDPLFFLWLFSISVLHYYYLIVRFTLNLFLSVFWIFTVIYFQVFFFSDKCIQGYTFTSKFCFRYIPNI